MIRKKKKEGNQLLSLLNALGLPSEVRGKPDVCVKETPDAAGGNGDDSGSNDEACGDASHLANVLSVSEEAHLLLSLSFFLSLSLSHTRKLKKRSSHTVLLAVVNPTDFIKGYRIGILVENLIKNPLSFTDFFTERKRREKGRERERREREREEA